IGLAPQLPAAEARHPAMTEMADCKMCAPVTESSATCAQAFCFKAGIGEAIAVPGRRIALVFAFVPARTPTGFETRPPTRPA
ncbi:MAG TPA: hypothetical protein VI582_03140, partial [Aestuariivirga sp.]|nr:hypothetical protein [Aestuariivirga sp.]